MAGAEGCCDAGGAAPSARGHAAGPLSPSRVPNALGDKQAGQVPGAPCPAEVPDGDPHPAAGDPTVLPQGSSPSPAKPGGPRGGPQGAWPGDACPCPPPISTAEPGVHRACTGCACACVCVCVACACTHRCRERSPAAVQHEIESLLSLASSPWVGFFNLFIFLLFPPSLFLYINHFCTEERAFF